jgi:hypothetical protein
MTVARGVWRRAHKGLVRITGFQPVLEAQDARVENP